jgi:hypothetical protein
MAALSTAFHGNYIPEIYSPKLIRKFHQKLFINQITNSDYEGEIKNHGDVVHIRQIPTIAVRDFACRNCQKDDMTINHRPLEIKSGRGEVVKGVDLLDTLDMLEKWIESDKLFIWFYDLSEWDYTAADAMEKMDDLPYVFTTCRSWLSG